jgi:putative flippase GtrA
MTVGTLALERPQITPRISLSPAPAASHRPGPGRSGRCRAAVAARPRGQLTRFVVVGVLTSLAYAGVYVAVRPLVAAALANAVALLLTSMLNTAAHRRFTFAAAHRASGWRQQLEAGAVLGLGLVLTSGAMAALDAVATPGALLEGATLTVANVAAAVLHYVLLRDWVFRAGRGPAT